MTKVLAHLLLFLSTVGYSFAQAPSEYDVKAAFILNFLRFTEFARAPAHSENSDLCVSGSDDVRTAFNKVEGKEASGRRIHIVIPPTIASLSQCEIIFLSSSSDLEWSQALQELQGNSVLTIGEHPQFTASGGMINFLYENSKVRFQINLDAAEKGGIKFSSKLLSLAKDIDED